MPNYLQSFQWNKAKYRADKPISELLDTLQKEMSAVDNDIKQKLNQYNSIKTNLASIRRGQTGNLSQKSLSSVVNPESLLRPDESEYLHQQILAVPSSLVKDFLKRYEGLTAMVVPRSAQLLAKDDEFHLYAVTVFKKHSAEFLHKCREHRWTPRDMKFNEGGKEADDAEMQKLEKEERRVWGEALRLGRASYSDAIMGWIHVLTLRVFVETVLRYGLPLSFVCGIVRVSQPLPFTNLPPRTPTDLVAPRRRSTNGPKRPRPGSTPASRSSAATPSAATRKAAPSRTIPTCSRRWPAPASRLSRATSRMCSTSLRSYRPVI